MNRRGFLGMIAGAVGIPAIAIIDKFTRDKDATKRASEMIHFRDNASGKLYKIKAESFEEIPEAKRSPIKIDIARKDEFSFQVPMQPAKIFIEG